MLETEGDPVTQYDSEFVYDSVPDSDFAGVVETAPVSVKRPLIV
jgi:hypothetical protein